MSAFVKSSTEVDTITWGHSSAEGGYRCLQGDHISGQSMEPVLRQMCAWGEWYSVQMGHEYQRLIPEAEDRVLLKPRRYQWRRTTATSVDAPQWRTGSLPARQV